MHSQKPISSNPEIQFQVYSIVPAQITQAGYVDFMGIWEKYKQTALFCGEERWPCSDEVCSTAIQTIAWGPA